MYISFWTKYKISEHWLSINSAGRIHSWESVLIDHIDKFLLDLWLDLELFIGIMLETIYIPFIPLFKLFYLLKVSFAHLLDRLLQTLQLLYLPIFLLLFHDQSSVFYVGYEVPLTFWCFLFDLIFRRLSFLLVNRLVLSSSERIKWHFGQSINVWLGA